MSWVAIRELRDGLSRHLAEVRAGRTVPVTDHGRPVARIVPIDRRHDELSAGRAPRQRLALPRPPVDGRLVGRALDRAPDREHVDDGENGCNRPAGCSAGATS